MISQFLRLRKRNGNDNIGQSFANGGLVFPAPPPRGGLEKVFREVVSCLFWANVFFFLVILEVSEMCTYRLYYKLWQSAQINISRKMNSRQYYFFQDKSTPYGTVVVRTKLVLGKNNPHSIGFILSCLKGSQQPKPGFGGSSGWETQAQYSLLDYIQRGEKI